MEVQKMNLGEAIRSKAVREPAEVYHSHPSVSCSMLREIMRSPLHYKRRYIDGVEPEPTPAKTFGTLAHAAILEPRRFLDQFVVEPPLRRNTKEYKSWLEAQPPEKLIISNKDSDRVINMCSAVTAHEGAASLLRGGIMEHSLYFTEPATGVQCRVRPDAMTEDGYVVDLKTTRDASRKAFMRSIAQYRYDVSAGLYTEAFQTVFGRPPKGYIFIAVEHHEPYAVAVYVADDSVTEIGLAAARRSLRLLKACADADHWPGYQDGTTETIGLPNWMIQEEDADDGTVEPEIEEEALDGGE
jgi:exodeoxyribonuclease VIII